MPAKYAIEIYERPIGFLDDHFRTGWVLIRSAASQSFVNNGGVVADLGIMQVTESGSSDGAGWEKGGLSVSTNTYTKFIARLRGLGYNPMYYILVMFTDATNVSIGWASAPSSMTLITLNLPAGKTVQTIQLFIRAGNGANNQSAEIRWDYVIIVKSSPITPTDVNEIDVELSTTTAISGFTFILINTDDSYTQKPDVGDFVMIHLAASEEVMEQKLISGYITDKQVSNDPAKPVVTIIGADLGQLFHDRTFTKKYTTATLVTQVMKDIQTQELPELTHHVEPDCDNSITPEFNEEDVFNLLKKLANVAWKNAPYGYGYDFYVDPAGVLRIAQNAYFSCSQHIYAGENIKQLTWKESIEDVGNEIKLLIREGEYEPHDKDSWTENTERWSSPDGATITADADKKEGSYSIKGEIYGAGLTLRLRREIKVDKSKFKKIKFWLKWSVTGPVDYWRIRITDKSDYSQYFQREYFVGQSAPASKPWSTMIEEILANFTKTGNVSEDVISVEIALRNSSQNLGDGVLMIDGLHFAYDPIYKTASDTDSQNKYGKKKRNFEDFTITDENFAQFVANSLCQALKNPIKHVHVIVPGRAQEGFRPPAFVDVKSPKDNIDYGWFRILKARHHYVTSREEAPLYICDLDLIAAKKTDGNYQYPIAQEPRSMRALKPISELSPALKAISGKGYYWY